MNCYIILKGILLPNTWASQQHKYLKIFIFKIKIVSNFM